MTVPTFTEEELDHFDQKTAIRLCNLYVCAYCYHNEGKASRLGRTHVPVGDDIDRFVVTCTECGGNVAHRSVGRITIWWLTHIGQERMIRAKEIHDFQRRIKREKDKQKGIVADPTNLLNELGF